MREMSIWSCFLIIALLLTVMTAQVHGQGEQLKIGVLASRGAEDTLKTWQPTAEYLSKEIPQYSFVIVPLDLDEIAHAVELKKIDFIITNPGNYVELETSYGATRIATMESMYGGHAYKVFGSVIFKRADRDIRDLKDLTGKSFMGVLENLFAWQMAWRELKDNNIDPYRDFKDIKFSGLPQDLVVYAVRDGEVDAGTVRTGILEDMAYEGKINLTDFVVLNPQHDELPLLHSTRVYPEWAFARAKHTSDELAEKVTVTLLSMPADSAAAKAANAIWTVPLDYQPVHELMKELRIGPYAEYGKMTSGDIVKTYWYWIIIAIAAVVLLTYTVGLKTVNKKLWQEITERRRAEEMLQQSESVLRSFFDSPGIMRGIVEVVAEDDVRHIADNAVSAGFIGLTPEAMKNKLGSELGEPREILRKWVVFYEQSRRTNKPVFFEYPDKRGEKEAWISATVSYLGTGTSGYPRFAYVVSDITERKQMEEALREKEERFRVIASNTPDYILMQDNQLRYLFVVNPQLGLDEADMIGKTDIEILENEDAEKLTAIKRKILDTGESVNLELSLQNMKGETEFFDGVYRPKFDSTGKIDGLIGYFRNITGRKRAEEKIQKANRVYAVISQINQAIVRVHEKDKILSEACRIAVEYGKLKMAWIGMIDEKTNLVNPIAYSGVEDGYLSKIQKISIEDVPSGRGQTGTAIREGRHYVCDDIEKDPQMAPWREEALKRGYRSSIALPIKHFGKVIGAFSLYASVPHFFDSEEIHLFEEVTNDISFALDSIEIAKKKHEAEEKLQKEQQFLAAVFDSIEEGIVSCDANGILGRFNRATRAFHGLPEESIPADQWARHYDLFLPDGKTPMKKEDVPLFRALQGKIVHNEEMMIIPKQGHARTFVVSGQKLVDTDGKIIGAVVAMHDITERKQAEDELEKHRFHLEEMVNERTAELERMNRLFIGRESKMKELKKRIAELEKERGKK